MYVVIFLPPPVFHPSVFLSRLSPCSSTCWPSWSSCRGCGLTSAASFAHNTCRRHTRPHCCTAQVHTHTHTCCLHQEVLLTAFILKIKKHIQCFIRFLTRLLFLQLLLLHNKLKSDIAKGLQTLTYDSFDFIIILYYLKCIFCYKCR